MTNRLTRFFPFFFAFLTLVVFVATIQATRTEIGKLFPGYLAFRNGVIGVYYVPTWEGRKKEMSYEERIPKSAAVEPGPLQRFTEIDFLLIVLFPAVSGLLFVLLGAALYLYLPAASGSLPLLLFHFLVGNYLILSPEAHLTYRFFGLHLALFTFLPAGMIHFSLLFPEPIKGTENRLFQALPYAASLLLLVPYLYFFLRNPSVWVVLEYVVLFYLIAAYLFWLVRLWRTLQKPYLEFNRIIARYLLLGQVLAFLVPLGAALTIFVLGIPFPVNLALPVTLLFPISIFIGVILARLRQSQMQLVQTEKWVALGSLLSGLAHEINNPMTFIYSNIEPLRETIASLKKTASRPEAVQELEGIADNIDEGATRAKGIIENFRYFSYPGRRRPEPIDLHRMLDQSLHLLTPKWKDRITIARKYGEIPMLEGNPGELSQVFVNLLANACDAIRERGDGTGGAIEIATRLAPPGAVGSEGIEVRIRDNGRGISESDLSRIFDPFYTTKPQGEGTGLGLAISLQIVKNHKGKIEVQSEKGKWTEFIITLPVAGQSEGGE
jgi:signal transduction histidine kinase